MRRWSRVWTRLWLNQCADDGARGKVRGETEQQGGLGRDKTMDEKWNGRCNRWRLGEETGQSFPKSGEWPRVMGDGNNEEPALFISALFQMRWKVMKQTELVSLYLYDFYICSWMGPKETSGQHNFWWDKLHLDGTWCLRTSINCFTVTKTKICFLNAQLYCIWVYIKKSLLQFQQFTVQMSFMEGTPSPLTL